MRKFTIPIAIVTGLIAPAALAADIGVKAPLAPPPAPVYNWTGWYVGVNAGASFGHATTDFNAAPITTQPLSNHFASAAGLVGPDSAQPDGFMGGGQIGYNWQWSPLIVLGVEADIQGALEKDTATLPNSFTIPAVIGTTAQTSVTDYSTKIEWFGTVRGRIGYVWGNGNVMSYLTGGLAYGKVDVEGTNTVSGSFAPSGGSGVFSVTNAFSHNAVNTGWVAGYGTEAVIDFWGLRNWTWKIEGLWMDLGHIDTAGVTSGSVGGGITSISGGQLTTHTHFTDGILRGGLNYKFY
jgi:outer membrane immunogenic protein